MLSEQRALTQEVIIQKKHKLAAGSTSACISRVAQPSPGLLYNHQPAQRLECSEKLGGAVLRAIYHHNHFITVRRQVLLEDGGEGTSEKSPAIVGCDYDRKYQSIEEYTLPQKSAGKALRSLFLLSV
jgi:hypothetical protein